MRLALSPCRSTGDGDFCLPVGLFVALGDLDRDELLFLVDFSYVLSKFSERRDKR